MAVQDLETKIARLSAVLACIDRTQDFKNVIREAGYIPPDNIPPGKIIAFPGMGKPTHNKAARCFLFSDRQGGWFMDYSTNLFEVWQAKRDKPYTEQEREVFRERCEHDRLARKQTIIQSHQQAEEKALKIWKRAIFVDDSNLYLHHKKVKPHSTKTGDSGGLTGVLIAPIYDESLKLVNLQFIQPDGTKRFLKGGRKKGCFWWIGKKTTTVLIAEGFATAASLHEATGHQVFIAFDGGNLVNVAKIVRGRNPDAEIIVCGDNDESGIGEKAAIAAALACGGKYILPATVGHDWNDAINTGAAL